MPLVCTVPTGRGLVSSASNRITLPERMEPPALSVSLKLAMAKSRGCLPGLLVSSTKCASVHSILSTLKEMSEGAEGVGTAASDSW